MLGKVFNRAVGSRFFGLGDRLASWRAMAGTSTAPAKPQAGFPKELEEPCGGSEIHHFFLDSARTGGMLTVQRMSVTGSYFPVAEGVSCLGASRGSRS